MISFYHSSARLKNDLFSISDFIFLAFHHKDLSRLSPLALPSLIIFLGPHLVERKVLEA